MLKKAVWTKWMVLVFSAVLLASCGGGGGGSSPGGGGDTMTLTVVGTGTSTATYNEQVSASNAYGYDPYLMGSNTPSSAVINVALYDTYVGPNFTDWTTKLTISIDGPTVDVPFTVTLQDVSYYKRGEGTYDADGTDGTVTFTQIDSSPGGLIKGTFTGVKVVNSFTLETRTVSGSFSVTRVN